MEYQKIITLLDNTPNQRTKFRTKNWVETNDDSRATYKPNSQFKFKTSKLRLRLVSGTITFTGAGNDDVARQLDERIKGVSFKNCAPFTN